MWALLSYVCRRLIRSALLLLGISILSFWLFALVPGDYFDELRTNPEISTRTVNALRNQYGLSGNPQSQYTRWFTSLLRGDWGDSIAYRTPAAPLLFARARNTAILTTTAILCAWLAAVPLAAWTVAGGVLRRRTVDSVMAALLAIPNLLILLVIMFLAARWRALPAGGMTSAGFGDLTGWQQFRDVAAHLAAPGAVLMLAALPTIFLHTRAALADVLERPFIQFARANGIPPRRLLYRHALPAAANPLITLLGLSAGTLLSSSLAVEVVAGWPGLGQLLLQSILQRDLVVVAGAVMLSAMLLLVSNLIADVLLFVVNPALREEL